MVPRWRSFAATSPIELSSVGKPHVVHRETTGLEEALSDWRRGEQLWSAVDLVSASIASGRSREADEAAKMVAANLSILPPTARSLLEAYGHGGNLPRLGALPLANKNVRQREARHLKEVVRVYPRNPISYLELARVQTALGQLKPADKALKTALYLAPSSRYVIRSYVRYLVHCKRFEEAWRLLNERAGGDPWLQASKIAVSELAKKPFHGSRNARRLLDTMPAEQTTELSAALGTLEMGAGALKKAKKHFRESAEAPTDNSVAQIIWAGKRLGMEFDEKLLTTEFSYEARSAIAARLEQWQVAASEARLWLIDEPFSARAADWGGYVAAELAHDFALSAEMSTLGLLAHPGNYVFLNNRAYARANMGEYKLATVDLVAAAETASHDQLVTYMAATEGCILYASGDPEAGAAKYRSSIEAARRLGMTAEAQLAYLHWIREEGKRGNFVDGDTAKEINTAFKDKKISEAVRNSFAVNAAPFLEMAIEKAEPAAELTQLARVGVEVLPQPSSV